MVEIKIKNSVIEPLVLYNPKLNDWHEKQHRLSDYKYCQGFLKDILEPIENQIKEVLKNERAKHRWHFASDFTKQSENSCKFLKKVFTCCKTILKETPDETIILSFIKYLNIFCFYFSEQSCP